MTQKYYQKNINEISPNYIQNEMGYDIYVPDVFYNPISFNKKGCPSIKSNILVISFILSFILYNINIKSIYYI